MIAVYDAGGVVTGAATRREVYAHGLWHASAGVLVRARDERIYVHLRTATKATWPSRHDCLAGGVVDAGETPEAAALRELDEELGVRDVAIRPLAQLAWDGEWAGKPLRCHLFAYEARHDGPFVHQASEIVDGWWWTSGQLLEHLADPAWPFVDDTRALVPYLGLH